MASTQIAMLTWCRTKCAIIRFHSDDTVSIRANGTRHRRRTLVEAWRAHVDGARRRRTTAVNSR